MSFSSNKHRPILLLCILLVIIGCSNKDKTLELRADIILPSIDQEIWEGEIVHFIGAASGGTPPYAYTWDFGIVTSSIDRNESGPIVFNYEGTYKVLFNVKDSKGNEDIDFLRIIVSPKSYLNP